MWSSSRSKSGSGLATLQPLTTIRAFRKDPLKLFADIAELPDGMARAKLFGTEFIFITHPDHVHRVLQENHQNYNKDTLIYNNARPFLGDGLPVTHGGEDWRHRRRLVQPAFHQRHIHMVTDVTARYLLETAARWQRSAVSGDPIDVGLAMSELAMRVACKTLFGLEVTNATGITRDFERASVFAVEFLTRPFPPLFVPTRRNRAFHAAMSGINAVVSEVVRERQADPEPHEDLLGLLVGALDDGSGHGLSRRQLQEELIALFFAAHDTTAHTLAWCWHLLAQHPEIDQRLHEELATVLAGRPATLADLPNLRYTRMVVDESMRLYPVAWATMRRSLGEDIIAGHRIAPGAQLMWSPYVGNRHADFWDDPESFRPERFGPDQDRGRCRHAVVPFGEGPRVCLGSHFALAEACLILATLAQRYQVLPAPGRPVKVGAAITLYPQGGLWAVLRSRSMVEVG